MADKNLCMINQMLCEYMTNPIGIHISKPSQMVNTKTGTSMRRASLFNLERYIGVV